jgi:hypothetical protein
MGTVAIAPHEDVRAEAHPTLLRMRSNPISSTGASEGRPAF